MVGAGAVRVVDSPDARGGCSAAVVDLGDVFDEGSAVGAAARGRSTTTPLVGAHIHERF